MRASEAGFSLIEILVATAVFTVVSFGAFEAVRQLAAAAQSVAVRRAAYAALERLSVQLRAEARSATAIWSSSPAAGGGHDDCVQLDFFTADAAGPAFWSYRTFPNHDPSDAVPAGALERLAAGAPIVPCDAAQTGAVVLSGVQAFAVSAVAPGDLGAHADAYLAQPDSPFVAAVPTTAPVALGVLDARGAPIAGGNAIAELRIDTAAGSRVVDLLPGVFPSGFTEVLRYTCTARCDVGHDTGAPKTLTACSMRWQSGWSEFVRWNDPAANPDGSLSFPGGWFIGGTFSFSYTGTRASDGGTDSLVKSYPATNWDAARNYVAYPPDRPAADGSNAGSFAPWDVRAEPASAWLNDLGPYLAAGENAPIVAEQQRCDAVQAEGAAGAFFVNG
ncbi:MAG TPA: prepilin-type N-terminal cleavage/methylation domain-containing protein [Candidatus Elarobacter sp.]|jgi:prepilin-type N-terminal cleavage/methylation domain-containing protein|nr:prepilin-type N-terminal cleavage/methylation domain-containing protein [Candidatus Elarobacter sp.]